MLPYMIFALPWSLRKHIWQLCLQMRNMELKKELLTQRRMHKQTYDMLANHHHLDEKYLYEHAHNLHDLFQNLYLQHNPSPKPIVGISEWIEWLQQAATSKNLSRKEQNDVCELLAAIILQYVHITKSAELSSLQITRILTLHDDLMTQN